MKAPLCIARILLAGLIVGGALSTVQAAEYVTLQEPGALPYQLGIGDKAPERFGRYENGMLNWKGKGLPQPNVGSQWVVIGDRFVLLRIGSGLIEQIVEVPN